MDFEESAGESDDFNASDDASESDIEDVLQDELATLAADQERDIFDVLLSCCGSGCSPNEIRSHLEAVIEYGNLEPGSDRFISLQDAAIKAGFEPDTFIIHHASVNTKERNEEVLIAHLLSSLPNLRELFVVFPDAHWKWEECAIQRTIVKSFEAGENRLLANLESLHICSALRECKQFFLSTEN